MANKVNISESVGVIRRSSNIAQRKVAKAVGITQQYYSHFEKGGDVPHSRLLDIVDFLGYSLVLKAKGDLTESDNVISK